MFGFGAAHGEPLRPALTLSSASFARRTFMRARSLARPDYQATTIDARRLLTGIGAPRGRDPAPGKGVSYRRLFILR